jgi:DNA-binding transcriptional LysR family regulator
MLDWDDLRFFLSIARHQTLSAAARDLHVTQSTVGRRLASLQAGLGVRLLQRTDDGYIPTVAGKMVLERVEKVASEARIIEHAVAGQDARPAGLVRVTSCQLVASHLLAPCFVDLLTRSQAIMIESLPPLLGEPLATQDADIAVRLRRFDHQDLIVRNIGAIAFGLYGSVAYFKGMNIADATDGCAGHQLVTLLDDRELSQQAGWLSEHGDRGVVVARADSYETLYALTACGAGLAVLPRFRADADPSLKRLATAVPVPDADILLAVHRENRSVPRVRVVLDCIAHRIRSNASVLNPQDS